MTSFRVCFIGDSLVAGTGDPEYLGWAGRICKTARTRGHDITSYNLGIRANSSADVLARWRREVEARDVQGADCRLVFAFGVNDTKDVNGQLIFTPEKAIAQARDILSEANSYRPTLMIGPPPIGEDWRNVRIRALSENLATLTHELGVPFFPAFETLSASKTWLPAVRAGDGVHPIAAGYDEWAHAIEQWPAWRAWAP
jgi:lysophospholipase L1-like esterase